MATAQASGALAVITFILSALCAAVPGVVAIQDYVIYSDPPQSLVACQSLTYDMTPQSFPYGPHELALGHDCNLVLTAFGKRTWSSNTSQENGQNCYLTLLPDGELVLRYAIHYPIWSSGAKSIPGKYAFILNAAGQLNVIGPELWANTDKVTMSEPYPAPATTDYIFFNGLYTMATFGSLMTYRNFRLVLQQDCNLVLKNMNSGEVLWQTGTNSTSGDCFATLDNFGELFVMHNRRDVLWRSGKRSDKEGQNWLVLRYDGRLVIYSGLVWALPQGTTVAAMEPAHALTSMV